MGALCSQRIKRLLSLRSLACSSSEMVVESRSVIRNAKNARGSPPFPSRARLNFALLVLILSHYTI